MNSLTPVEKEQTTEATGLHMPHTLRKRDETIAYERARASAWEARCRIAVRALARVLPFAQHKGHCGFGSNNPNCICGALHEYVKATEALAQIGELPKD